MAPDADVPALVGEVCARPDVPAAPPEDDDEAPAGAPAEVGLLAEPDTPLDWPALPPPPPHALRITLLTTRNIENLSSFIIFYSVRKRQKTPAWNGGSPAFLDIARFPQKTALCMKWQLRCWNKPGQRTPGTQSKPIKQAMLFACDGPYDQAM